MDEFYPYYLEVKSDFKKIQKDLIADPKVVVFFDARNIMCEEQILTAVLRTARAFKFNNSIAKQFKVELMLQLAGTHQIKIALDLFNVSDQTNIIILFHTNNNFQYSNVNPGFPIFSPGKSVFELFNIKSVEFACKEMISRGARLVADYE